MKTRHFYFIGCLMLSFSFASVANAATFLESGGKVVIETESADPAGAWSRQNSISGAKGGAYLVWTGANFFGVNSAGSGILRYTFRVQEAGNYELRWRSYIAEGNNATEANDSWVRFPTGQNISGQHALNGWTKAFQNQLNQWSWSAKTVDNVGRPIRQYFSAGDHVIEISGRSHGHAIDRLVMFQYDKITYSQSTFEAFAVSSTVGGNEPPVQPTPEPPTIEPTTPETPTNSGNCEASGSNLGTAIQAYAASCPGIPRRDCDPVGNGWTCSSGVIGNNGSGVVNPPTQEPTSVEPPVVETPVVEPLTPETPTSSGICEASGTNLGTAMQAYAANCPGIPRKDCDPVGNGWTCSSGIIGSNGPGVANPPTQQPPTPEQPTEEPAVEQPPVVEQPTPETPTNSGTCEASGSNLSTAIQAYALSCPGIPRKDCDPVGNGWTCSSGVIGTNGPGVSNPPSQEPPTVTPPSEEPPVVVTPTPEPPTSPNPNGTIGRVGANDLVALHYDNCPDRDDGHALPSGKAVVDRSGLSNVIVVNGTCGDNIRNSYQPGSEAVARAVWGNQWLDYFNQPQASVQAAALRWAQVLANGGEVWVAEGGPSDFTASVLQSLNSQNPSLNLKNVHVIQHAAGTGFNEANSARIGVVKALSDYRAIPNGNIGGNGSANLNTRSTFFVGVARQSEYSSEWNAAFNYLDPNRRLDFSDTVELLYLINDTSTNSVDAFARNYLQ